MLRGLSIRSIAVIFAPVTVNLTRVTGFPSAAVTMPMAPLIRAGKLTWAIRVKGNARAATAAAPRTTSVPLERTTTSWSRASIIHCATSTRGDAEATRNLVAAASLAGSGHLVYVSIVGIDHIASWGYPKTKLQAEQIVASSGLPWTILRVTQFYDYCLANARKLSRLPVVPVPAASLSSQLIPATWRPDSSSWRWASPSVARRTWPARR